MYLLSVCYLWSCHTNTEVLVGRQSILVANSLLHGSHLYNQTHIHRWTYTWCAHSTHRHPQYESVQVSCSAGHSLMNTDTTLRWIRARPAGVLYMKHTAVTHKETQKLLTVLKPLLMWLLKYTTALLLKHIENCKYCDMSDVCINIYVTVNSFYSLNRLQIEFTINRSH